MTPRDLEPRIGTYWRLIEPDPCGCWAWGGRYKGQTPVMKWRGREATVARAMWEATRGAAPTHNVIRKCGRGWCCHPAHLWHKGQAVRDGEVIGYCRNGHPRTTRSLYMYGREYVCKACRRPISKRRQVGRRVYATRAEFIEGCRQHMARLRREGRIGGPPGPNHPWRRDEEKRLGQNGAVGGIRYKR